MECERGKGSPQRSSFSKKLLLNILQAIPDLISVVDTDYRIVFSNWRGGHEYVSLAQREKPLHCYEVYYPELGGRCEHCHIEEVFRSGEQIIAEKYNPRVGHLEIHAFPIFDEAGNVAMVGEYLRNINARRRAEEALRDANHMLEAIIEASPLAIIALDPQVNLTLWNSAAEHTFGWKKEQVLGKPYPIVPQELHDELWENIHGLNQGEVRRSLQTRRTHKDGTLIDVSLSTAAMVDQVGNTIGYMAIMADIRERKLAQEALRESEANYRTIFDAANDATFVFDPENGVMLDVNLRMCEMYGYTREEVLRLNVENLSADVPPYTRSDLLKLIWKTRHDNSHMFEWLAKDRSGKLFWVEVNMKGAVIGGEYRVLAVVKDITERKAQERENQLMQERLRQVDRMAAIGTLASGIAHEINNPNNFILSNGQFISDIWPDIGRVLDDYARENGPFHLGRLPYSEACAIIPRMLNGVVEGAHRINGIVTGLKGFARQEKTRLDQQVQVNQVIKTALTMLQNQVKTHTDHFRCELAQELPPVKGSFRQLEQVVVNLAMNALESLEDRSRGVSITTAHFKERGQVVLKVTDEGTGMTEDVKKTIFDPFFTTKLDSGGTGLGLSICYSIVKEHQGIVACESRPGSGTTFIVSLPALDV